MNRQQALAHLHNHLDQALTDSPPFPDVSPGLTPSEVLTWLGQSGIRRTLAAAYLEDSPGHFWPAFSTPQELWRLINHVLMHPEPRAVVTCPSWCDEHGTARHSILDEDARGSTGYSVAHQTQHGQHVSIQTVETSATAHGPTLPSTDGPQLLLLVDASEETLTADQARTLARHLLAAAAQLESLHETHDSDHQTDPSVDTA